MERLRHLIKQLTLEIMSEEEDLEEVNTTASVGGEYMTPMAFTDDDKSKKKKKKKKN